jgi:type VI secretion system protein ImpH
MGPDGSKAAGDAVRRVQVAPPASWSADSLAARLFREPFSFDFFQAVRLLERLFEERSPVGQAATPAAEAVHFRTLASLNFPPSAIYDLERAADPAQPPIMTVAFMGLTGPSGVLPRHYTELLLRIQREAKGPEKFALRDWLDLFNHRYLSLFYRAWEKYRFYLAYERGEATKAEPDTFTSCLYSLVGHNLPALRNRLRVGIREDVDGRPRERVLTRVNDLVLLYYGGLLAHRPRCAIGLAGMLQDYLGLPAEVRQFQGQWLRLEPDKQSRLGLSDGNSELGTNLVIGERVWDVQSKIRVRVGPVSYARFLDFLPDRTPMPEHKTFFELVHLVRLYLGPEFDFDMQVILKADEVPECQLPEGTADGPRLGWNAWIGSQSFAAPAEEAVFEGEEVVSLNA